MPWGAAIRAFVPFRALRIAALASILFWLGLALFVAVELMFGGDQADTPSWLEPLDDTLIFIVWIAACVATIASILAMRAEKLALHHTGPAMKSSVPGEGGQCSAL